MSEKEELARTVKKITFIIEYSDGEKSEASFTISELIKLISGPLSLMVPVYISFVYFISQHLKVKR
jgi:hypothetical protein